MSASNSSSLIGFSPLRTTSYPEFETETTTVTSTGAIYTYAYTADALAEGAVLGLEEGETDTHSHDVIGGVPAESYFWARDVQKVGDGGGVSEPADIATTNTAESMGGMPGFLVAMPDGTMSWISYSQVVATPATGTYTESTTVTTASTSYYEFVADSATPITITMPETGWSPSTSFVLYNRGEGDATLAFVTSLVSYATGFSLTIPKGGRLTAKYFGSDYGWIVTG